MEWETVAEWGSRAFALYMSLRGEGRFHLPPFENVGEKGLLGFPEGEGNQPARSHMRRSFPTKTRALPALWGKESVA